MHPVDLYVERWKKTLRFILFFQSIACCSVFAQYRIDPNSLLTAKRQTGARFGKWVLHGAFTSEVMYDTNVFFDDVGPRSDFGFELIPGADLIFEGSRVNFILGYRFKRIDYLKQNMQDFNANTAYLKGSYIFSRKFMLKLDDFFEQTSDPADRDVPERVARTSNMASVELVHRTPADDLETGLKYSNYYQKYDTAFAGLDYYNNKILVNSKINISSQFRFLPKSILLINGEYGLTNFNNNSGPPPQNSDSQGWSLTTGLSSQFTRKLNVSGQVGFSGLYFDRGTKTNSVVGVFTSAYQASPKLTLTAGYQRKAEASTFTDYLKEHAFTFDVKSIVTNKINMDLHNRVGFINFSGPNVVPTGQTRDDFLYQLDYALNYEVKPWLKPKLSYSFIYRDSNSTSFFLNSQSANFVKHQVGLGVDLYY